MTLPDISRRVARVGSVVEDVAYVAIGFGVLGVQRLQVQRREIARALTSRRAGHTASSN